ncbi:Hypothetical predicted protein [Pelobates cultripes]|uniref:Uncharacterized protein n=1 Tax=Pelobates cultripes TaxID=61616 RepID=A0AAD1WRA4_PELCU|nr:Hypothetical predicted protein [Pelobates cultripes]
MAIDTMPLASLIPMTWATQKDRIAMSFKHFRRQFWNRTQQQIKKPVTTALTEPGPSRNTAKSRHAGRKSSEAVSLILLLPVAFIDHRSSWEATFGVTHSLGWPSFTAS